MTGAAAADLRGLGNSPIITNNDIAAITTTSSTTSSIAAAAAVETDPSCACLRVRLESSSEIFAIPLQIANSWEVGQIFMSINRATNDPSV